MVDLVRGNIEAIVGRKRAKKKHYGRAVTAETRLYVMHSKECLEENINLRDCIYSKALDNGIDMDDWLGHEDKPVELGFGVRRVYDYVGGYEGDLVILVPVKEDS